jgi:hypothetical protein
VEIDWLDMMRQARWEGLGHLWTAILTNTAAHWWFGPLLAMSLVAAGRKKLLRLVAHVARVFVNAHYRS